jgi:hypothetical protein
MEETTTYYQPIRVRPTQLPRGGGMAQAGARWRGRRAKPRSQHLQWPGLATFDFSVWKNTYLAVAGGKEGYALHVVPMKVGQEDISADPSLAKLLRATLSKPPKTRPAIQDDERAVSQPDFHACRVTSVAASPRSGVGVDPRTPQNRTVIFPRHAGPGRWQPAGVAGTLGLLAVNFRRFAAWSRLGRHSCHCARISGVPSARCCDTTSRL